MQVYSLSPCTTTQLLPITIFIVSCALELCMYVYTVVFWQPSIHSMRTQTIPERRGRPVVAPQCSHLEWNDLLLCVLSEIKYHSRTYFCTSQIFAIFAIHRQSAKICTREIFVSHMYPSRFGGGI